MKTFFLSLAGAFAALLLFVLVVFGSVAWMFSGGDDTPESMVLTVDLRKSLSDQAREATALDALNGSASQGFIDVVSKIEAAAKDQRVKGLFIRASDGSTGSARAEELRTAIMRFRQAGKSVVAHSQGTYSVSPSTLRAISAADEIWIQPGTDMMTSGLSFESMFYKDLLEKLSVQMDVIKFAEYKNAPNQWTETSFTAAHREAMTQLGEDIWQLSLTDIANDRKLSIEEVRSALEEGPKSAERMIELGLMDKLGWPEDARLAIGMKLIISQMNSQAEKATTPTTDDVKKLFDEVAMVSILSYRPPALDDDAPVIALIGGEGGIVTGSGGSSSPFESGTSFGSDRIASAILAAADDERVEAIVFRIDSGGGSPTASDQIWNAIDYAKDEGKPVVVSMGSVAASGGYYVAAGADHIFANRATITGSIGIFFTKPAIDQGLSRLGIDTEQITIGGEFANFLGADALTPPQIDALRASVRRGYDRFLFLVAQGRFGGDIDAAEAVAKGRVWSGVAAKENGLIDEFGGYTDAVKKASSLAGYDAGAAPRVLRFPAQPDRLLIDIAPFIGAETGPLPNQSQIGALLSDPRLAAILQDLRAIQSSQPQAYLPSLIEK